MRTLLAAFLLSSIIFACSKENDNEPDPVVVTPPAGSPTLLKSIRIHNYPANDSSVFSYDNNKRLIKEDFRWGSSRVITDISRNSAGTITGYTRTYKNAQDQVYQTETAVVQSDPVTGKYKSKVVDYYPNINYGARDSVLYTYTGANITNTFQYVKPTLSANYDSARKSEFFYGSGGLYKTSSFRYYYGWMDHNVQELGSDTTANPLFHPEVGMIVGLSIQKAEDDNFNWNSASMINGNVTQTITYLLQWATFKYTYNSFKQPIKRTYHDMGTLMNEVYFTYY